MGVTKAELFNVAQNELALLFKALGHPARLAIVEHLLKAQTCICTDMVQELKLAQPTISQHLKELKHAGIIKGRVEGVSVCYCLDNQRVALVKSWIDRVSGTAPDIPVCC